MGGSWHHSFYWNGPHLSRRTEGGGDGSGYARLQRIDGQTMHYRQTSNFPDIYHSGMQSAPYIMYNQQEQLSTSDFYHYKSTSMWLGGSTKYMFPLTTICAHLHGNLSTERSCRFSSFRTLITGLGQFMISASGIDASVKAQEHPVLRG